MINVIAALIRLVELMKSSRADGHAHRLRATKHMDGPDFFTRVEWWIFRVTSIVLLLVLAVKLIVAEITKG